MLQLSNITHLPCDKINITVSGYNGLDGEAITASGWYGYSHMYTKLCFISKYWEVFIIDEINTKTHIQTSHYI